jgi:hypothetical protein
MQDVLRAMREEIGAGRPVYFYPPAPTWDPMKSCHP